MGFRDITSTSQTTTPDMQALYSVNPQSSNPSARQRSSFIQGSNNSNKSNISSSYSSCKNNDMNKNSNVAPTRHSSVSFTLSDCATVSKIQPCNRRGTLWFDDDPSCENPIQGSSYQTMKKNDAVNPPQLESNHTFHVILDLLAYLMLH